LIYLSIHVLVAVVNGFKSATSLDDNDTEHALGRDIHDGVQARFHGGGDHSLTFSNDPDNGVKGPQDNGHPCNFVVKSTCFFTILVDFGVLQEDGDNVDESNHAEDEEEPFVLVWGLSTSAAEANHKHIHDNNLSDFISWSSGKGEDVPKHERSGKNPVDISSPVDGRESSGNFFDPHAASSGEHKKISKGGNSGDSHGENFEEFASGDALSSHVEVKSGKSHADETDKEGPVSEVTKVIFHGVWELFDTVDWSKVSSPLWANGRVQEFFNSAFDVVKMRGVNDNSSGFLVLSKGVSRDNKSFLRLENVFSWDVSFSKRCESKEGNNVEQHDLKLKDFSRYSICNNKV